jgi:uncharacterized protein YndB with AHSA1/START domain
VELNEAILVERPPTEVFDAWARIDRAGRHVPAIIERTRLTDGPIGPGARFRAVDRWPGLDVAYTVEITAFERPERIAATWSNPLSGGWDAIFEPRTGGTEVHFHATLHPSGIHGLALRLLWPWYLRQVRTFLETFRASLEGTLPSHD